MNAAVRMLKTIPSYDWPRLLTNELHNRPLVLLCGLLVALIFLFRQENNLYALPGVPLLVGAFVAFSFGTRRRVLLISGAVAVTLAALWQQGAHMREEALDNYLDCGSRVTGIVVREPTPSAGGFGFWLEVERLTHGRKTVPLGGRVWVYIPPDLKVRYLERVEITGEIRAVETGSSDKLYLLSLGDKRLLRSLGITHPGKIKAAGECVRQKALAVLEPILPPAYSKLHAGLLGSLFFGTHGTALPKPLKELFHRTGTIHILVVSGTQISLLFTLVYFPGLISQWRRKRQITAHLRSIGSSGRARKDGRPAWGLPRMLPSPQVIVLGLVLMSLYALLTEGGKPITRAAVMAALIGLALLFKHIPYLADRHGLDLDRYTLLAAAALGILLLQPEALFETGFQLSFAAVWGIVFLAPRLRRLLPRWNDFWAYLIVAPIAAQAATLPFIAWHHNSLPIIGFFSNMVVVPIAALLLWLGLAAFIVGLVASGLAAPLGWVCGQLCWVMTRSLAVFDVVPGGVLEVGEMPWYLYAGYFLLLAATGGLLGVVLPEREQTAQ